MSEFHNLQAESAIEEELEPLFDYSRVQPLNLIRLDDDSDSSPVKAPKRRKLPIPLANKEDEKEGKSVHIIDVEEKDEEDWLPPPPRHTGDASNADEDSVIRELRVKKQELASLALSAGDVLQAVEEAAKRSLEEAAEQPSMPSADRVKIVISIQDKDGAKQFRIFEDDNFGRLFRMYADKVKIDLQSLVFSFDGDKISPTSTPQGLEMEDGDIIEVHVKSS